jgi:hypothetical protein
MRIFERNPMLFLLIEEKKMHRSVTLSLLLLFTHSLFAQERTNPHSQSGELGKVSWLRDYDEAVRLAAKEQKDMLILFQEVPGCATCRNYGHNVLTHPLMVEAIENLFIPLAIFNNKEGKDRKVLQQFGEPSWNNPVVRIVSANGSDLVERIAGNYSIEGLYQAMETTLKEKDRALPLYFQLLGQEIFAEKVTERHYQMYCFWSGEKHLGQASGVLSTEPGFMKGHEVVQVQYDPSVISAKELDKHANKGKCTYLEEDRSYRPDKDPQYYLKQTAYRYLPLSKIQKTKINSALGKGEDATRFLSPKQKVWLKEAMRNDRGLAPLYTLGIVEAWEKKKNSSK